MNTLAADAIPIISVLTVVATATAAPLLIDVWDGISGRYIVDLSKRLRDLRVPEEKIQFWLRMWGAALLFVAVLLGPVFGMWPVAAMGVYLVFLAPKVVGSAVLRGRTRLLRDQIVTAATALANACRAGLSLPQGLESVARETAEPLAGEFTRIVGEYNSGRPLREALLERRDQLQLEGFNLFSSALVVCLERGGKVTEALDRISRSLLETQRLERKIEADTQSGRQVATLLAVFPFLFLGGFYLLDPEGTGLIFSTVIGQVILVVVIAIVYFCTRWAGKIVNINV